MTTAPHDRDRLMGDPSAADALWAWGQRHDDPCARAVALAHMGPHPQRWARITTDAPALSLPDLDALDRALVLPWPDLSRSAPPAWALPNPLPCVRVCRALSLSAHLSPSDAQTLAASPHLRALTHLNLAWNNLGPDGTAALAASPHLRALTSLNLSDNNLGPDGAAALAASPLLATVRALDLTSNFIGPDGAAALTAHLPPTARFTHLTLRACALTPAPLPDLLRHPALSRLTALDLSLNPLTSAGVTALTTHLPASPHLTRLSLAYTNLRDADAAALPHCPALTHLIHLDLSGNPVSARTARALTSALPHLTHLDLSHTRVRASTADALTATLQRRAHSPPSAN